MKPTSLTATIALAIGRDLFLLLKHKFETADGMLAVHPRAVVFSSGCSGELRGVPGSSGGVGGKGARSQRPGDEINAPELLSLASGTRRPSSTF